MFDFHANRVRTHLLPAVAFNLFDVDGDETIERSELMQILGPSFTMFSQDEVESILDTTLEEFGTFNTISRHRAGADLIDAPIVCVSVAGEPPEGSEGAPTCMTFGKFDQLCREQPAALSIMTIPGVGKRA